MAEVAVAEGACMGRARRWTPGVAVPVVIAILACSGSLVASAGLHWATNALGVLASAVVWTWETR